MFKLTFFLCAGLFAAMYFGGADHGQQRFGLLEKPHGAAPPAVISAAAPATLPVTQAVFTPNAPLMATPVAVETVAEPAIATEGVLMVVNTKSANVRSGPGKDYGVVGRLMRGDAVLVVAQGEGPDGWALIRIEGDGIEGYIATRLLRE